MVTDAGMELCGVIDSEDELQQWLETTFETVGWTAIREVSPHSSNHRADLIVRHDNYGWVGIETKYIKDDVQKLPEAHHQIIQKYRNRRYIGERIELWAVCPYVERYNTESDETPDYYERRRRSLIRDQKGFFDAAGIGWINLDHYHLNIQFVESRDYGRIPTGYLSPEARRSRTDYSQYSDAHKDGCDIDKIRESVCRKTNDVHYGRPVTFNSGGRDD